MTTRLTPKEEQAIREFWKGKKYLAYYAHFSLLLAEIDALRNEIAATKAGLVWSDELPTEPGLYWLQTRWRIAKKMPPQVVEVEFVDGELAVLFHGRENSCFADQYDDYQQQWSGPLVPPETEA